MSAEIHYQRLNPDNFTGHSLDDFVRRQTVTESWRRINKEWKLVPNVYEENWTPEQCRIIAEDVLHHIKLDQMGFGAFDGERLIGFATVSRHVFGVTASYVQLVCFQVSEEYRRRGIGRKLFFLACREARRLGARKLYISAHSSRESQAAYRALGCTPAEEVNERLAAEEPFDVQMEYRLTGGEKENFIVDRQLAPSVLARSAFCERAIDNAVRIGCDLPQPSWKDKLMHKGFDYPLAEGGVESRRSRELAASP